MAGKKILVIDNEIEFATMVKLNLEQTDTFEVKVETKGARAVETAKVFEPDLIFLDVLMPDMEGGAVLHEIKQIPKLKGIQVVFLTALVDDKEVSSQDGFIGGQAYLAKPVTTEKLLDCINKFIKY